MLTLDILSAVCTKAPRARLELVLSALLPALDEGEITTPARLAMLLAQLAHESAEFRYQEEIASGQAYEGRKDLGNVQAGDGVRFKGRGWIQLTGRLNYRGAGAALGLPLESAPALAVVPIYSARIALWYWRRHNLNAAADAGDLDKATRLINGGLNGLESRAGYYSAALAALGFQPVAS